MAATPTGSATPRVANSTATGSRPAPVAVTHPLVALLHAAPHTSEALAIASGRALSEVLASLTELELEGRVICESGRWLAGG